MYLKKQQIITTLIKELKDTSLVLFTLANKYNKAKIEKKI